MHAQVQQRSADVLVALQAIRLLEAEVQARISTLVRAAPAASPDIYAVPRNRHLRLPYHSAA